MAKDYNTIVHFFNDTSTGKLISEKISYTQTMKGA